MVHNTQFWHVKWSHLLCHTFYVPPRTNKKGELCPTNSSFEHAQASGPRIDGEKAGCMSHQRALNALASNWSTTTDSVFPTKWWVFEKRRRPTSDCEVATIGVSPTKYDMFFGDWTRFVDVASFQQDVVIVMIHSQLIMGIILQCL